MGNYFINKDKTPNELNSNVVYEYKCSNDKSIQYIRFTLKPLTARVKYLRDLLRETIISKTITLVVQPLFNRKVY